MYDIKVGAQILETTKMSTFFQGYLDADDFLNLALVSMQKQADRMDDVRAAFRYTKLCVKYLELNHTSETN